MNLPVAIDRLDLSANPTILFGLLIRAECGADESALAAAAGMPLSPLLTLLEKARSGECSKVPPVNGHSAAPQQTASKKYVSSLLAGERREVLVERWMRRVVRHLVKHSDVESHHLVDLIGSSGETTIGVQMRTLAHQLKTLGVELNSEKRRSKNHIGYFVDPENRERLEAIVKADWLVAVKP